MELTLLQLHPLHKLIKNHISNIFNQQEDKWASKSSTTKLSRIAIEPQKTSESFLKVTQRQSEKLRSLSL
jgi:hypothetical protein